MASSISVAVRVRPPTERERNLLMPTPSSSAGIFGDGCLTSTPTQSSASVASHRSLRPIIKVLDQRVLIFDPPESNPLQQAQRQILARMGGGKKVKDMRFCFDRVFDDSATQEDVYEGCAKDLVGGVLDGFNATVFAYGATGCGKTHTITGTREAPGIVYQLMKDLFGRIADQADDMIAEVTISYLEIYNETIRDLLNPNAPVLNLREANTSVSVPGLSTMAPETAADVIGLISQGNCHRTVHGTEANAVSSRSHAVLSVNIRRKPKTAGLIDDWTVATLSVIDLAGSERASATKNKGDRLLEGANINKSLLALGNCINALCDPKGRGQHVPYRNSKLTRLLKHSLGGNCRTLMIVCVAPTSAHYDETHNTLQYANRAKEIKTKAVRNIISVDRHVSQYVQVIFQLRQELEDRKKNDAVREDRVRKEQARHREDTDANVLKARRHWEDYMMKAQPAHRAQGRLEGLDQLRSVLYTWNEAIVSDSEASQELKEWIGNEVQPYLSTIAAQYKSAQYEVEQGLIAKSMYEACVNSLGRNVERSLNQEGKAIFDREIEGWAHQVGDMIFQSSRTEGKAQVLTHMVSQLASWLVGLAGQFLTKPISENLRIRFGQATKAAFQSLTSPGSASPNSLAVPPSSSIAFAANSLSTSVFPQPSNGGDSSYLKSTDTSMIARPAKSRQSTSSSPSKAAATYFSKRTSPRKQVVFPARQTSQAHHHGILKSRSTSNSSRSSMIGTNSTTPTAVSAKSTGVRWRDEESDGDERLESFDQTASLIESNSGESSMLSDQSSNLFNLPSLSLTNCSKDTSKPAGPLPLSNITKSPDESTANASVAASSSTGLRSNRMKAGYLARRPKPNQPPSTLTRLDSLGEEEEGDVTVTMPNQISEKLPSSIITLPPTFSFSRLPLSDTINTGTSSKSVEGSTSETIEGSESHVRTATGAIKRRESLVGPIRKVKPARRESLNLYRKQSGRASLVPTIGENDMSMTSRTMTSLRASRAPIIDSKRPEPGNLSLSPRKLGGATSRLGSIRAGRRSLAVGVQGTTAASRPRRVSLLPTPIGSTSSLFQRSVSDTSKSVSAGGLQHMPAWR